MDILTFFSSLDPNQVSLAGIVTLVVISIIRGWLIPRGVVRDRMADKDKQILALGQERDDWKTAFQKSEEGRAVLTTQNSDLIDGAETTNRLIESLRNQIEIGPQNRSLPPASSRSRYNQPTQQAIGGGDHA